VDKISTNTNEEKRKRVGKDETCFSGVTPKKARQGPSQTTILNFTQTKEALEYHIARMAATDGISFHTVANSESIRLAFYSLTEC
jgi:hypothetical protein